MTDSCYYQLSLSNVSIENANDSNVSTVSNMHLTLDKELDLHNHIYLRSLAVECCLDNFSLSNLPSTFTNNESINLKMTIPSSLTDGNAVFVRESNEERNKTPCKLPMTDLVTSNPQTAVDNINNCIKEYCNLFLCLRYLEIICDTDLFKESCMTLARDLELSSRDFSLIFWYLEASVIYRMQLAAVLDDLLQKTESMTPKPPRSVPVISNRDEITTTQSSSLFKPLTNRTRVAHRLITFSDLHSINFTDPSSALSNLVERINVFLSQQGFLTRINNQITAESTDILNTIRENNLLLLRAAKTTHDILKIELSKHDSLNKKGLNKLYHNEMLRLSLDSTGKCVFETNPTLFLPLDDWQFTVTFDNHASRVLGLHSATNERLQIGPITRAIPLSDDEPRSVLKRRTILSKDDRLFSRVKPMSRSIFVLSDIISNDCHYETSWTNYSIFSAYQILASYQIDDMDIKTQSFSKLSHPRKYCRIKQAENILRDLHLVMVDESFHPLIFQAKTYCYLSLCLKPADLNV